MDEIIKYFPGLDDRQKERFAALGELYGYWNRRINLISRKDFENFYTRHVLHSLAIARFCRFDPYARILDVGTGGGFPGIPLAIFFPEARFTLVDSIAKKTSVVTDIVTRTGLDNITVITARAETLTAKFDYVVSRAVTDMPAFVKWVWNKIDRGQCGSVPNGIIYLKGGDLADEMKRTGKPYNLCRISDYFPEEFFDTKQIVYIRK